MTLQKCVQKVNIEDGSQSVLFGVYLLSDCTSIPVCSLGAMLLSSSSVNKILLAKVRQMIIELIHHCPSCFIFYTSKLWPISSDLENTLYLSSVVDGDCIYIKQIYEFPKVGIINESHKAIGFVFINYEQKLSELRSLINSQVSFFEEFNSNFNFLDTNGWPVPNVVENNSPVADIIMKSCVMVCSSVQKKVSQQSDEHTDYGNENKHVTICNKIKQLSFNTSKDVFRRKTVTKISNHCSIPSDTSSMHCSGEMNLQIQDEKQLLISYVRAEAAEYALRLKTKLSEIGYSVYLDVHEISVGVDWQDSLNFAVSTCQFFIPLITRCYGETLWTNREVKLADVLGKHILPINFCNDWPPRSLAIQFATTQFVMHRRKSKSTLECNDAIGGIDSNWTEEDVEATAADISHRLNVLQNDAAGLMSAPSQLRRGLQVKRWLDAKAYSVWLSIDNEMPDSNVNNGTPSNCSGKVISSVMRDIQLNRQALGDDFNPCFQSVADGASAVLVILSESFASSELCMQHLYYCEQRKPLMPLFYEDFTLPSWLSMLIGSESLQSAKINRENYKHMLISQLERIIHSSSFDNLETLGNEAKINLSVDFIKNSIDTKRCVYICGSSSRSDHYNEEICRCLGVQLAHLDNVDIASGGFYGAADTVCKAFYHEIKYLQKNQEVWHIIPDRDPEDMSKIANQNMDRTFAVASFGKTLFCGNSVEQRKSIVSRCFEVCILIAGGKLTSKTAEEFVWNDHTVVPIPCTGGAAAGNLSSPPIVFQRPLGVSEYSWRALLSIKDSSPQHVTQCVIHVISSLLSHMSTCPYSPANDVTATGTIAANRSVNQSAVKKIASTVFTKIIEEPQFEESDDDEKVSTDKEDSSVVESYKF